MDKEKIKRLASLKRKLDQMQKDAYEATKEHGFNQSRDRSLWRQREPVYNEYRRLKAEIDQDNQKPA